MNIFLRELRSQRASLIFWSIGMFVMVFSGMAKYGTYAASGQSVNELFKQLPKAMKAVFGVGSFDLTQAIGFYGVLYLYLIVMATIHSVILGSNIIAKEERDRTSEFLFVKPISRARVITSKLSAAIFSLVILNVITFASSIAALDYYGKGASTTHDVIVLMTGIFLAQLIFLSVGMVFASISKNPKSTTSKATGVLLATFVLYIAINVNEKLDGLKYLSPYKYFDAKDLLANGRLDPAFLILSALIFFTLLAATYKFYIDRDLSV